MKTPTRASHSSPPQSRGHPPQIAGQNKFEIESSTTSFSTLQPLAQLHHRRAANVNRAWHRQRGAQRPEWRLLASTGVQQQWWRRPQRGVCRRPQRGVCRRPTAPSTVKCNVVAKATITHRQLTHQIATVVYTLPYFSYGVHTMYYNICSVSKRRTFPN